jgi:hypothetical protein
MILEQGRPQNTEGRQERELRVYDLLDSLALSYQRVDHEAAETMEVCQKNRCRIRCTDLQESLFVQPTGNGVLPFDDAGGKAL